MEWVKLLIKVGLIPIKQNACGEFEYHFLNLKYLALLVSQQLMFGVIFYYWLTFFNMGIVGIIKTVFFFININGSVGFYLLLSLIIKRLQGKAVIFKCKASWKETITIFLLISIYISLFWVMTYDFLVYIINQESILIRIFTLFAVAYIGFRAIFDFYGFLIVLFNWLKMEDLKGKEVLKDEKLNVNSADYLLEDYVMFKDSVQLIVLTFSTTILTTFILSVYLAIQGGSLADFAAVPMVLCTVIVQLYSTIMCERIYKNLQQVAEILADKSLEQDTHREAMSYQRQAEKMRNHGKFTGCGFFELDMTTLTAMAEISLTYIIVLAQNT